MVTDSHKLDTPYGPIWAHASSGNTMSFRTGYGDNGSDEQTAALTINRKRYRFEFTLTTRAIPAHRSTYFQHYGPDNAWRVIDTGAEHRAVKAMVFDGNVTDGAKATARLKILPMLGQWLGTERAKEMLAASADDERKRQLDSVGRTLTAIGEAVVIVGAIQRKLERGEPLTDTEVMQATSAGTISDWLETGRFPR